MGRPRSQSERVKDRVVTARLYRMGYKQQEIAEKIERSQGTVSRDLAYLQKQWKVETEKVYALARAEQLDEYVSLKREYYEAWDASKTTVTIRGAAVESGEDGMAIITQKEGPGEPSFLQGVERMRDRIDRFWGLNAPELLALVDQDFNQERWANERDARHARAMELLEADDGEDQ